MTDNLWVVALADGRTCEVEADRCDYDGGAMIFSCKLADTFQPVAVFPARSWTLVQQKDAHLVFTEPLGAGDPAPRPFTTPFA